MRVILIVLTLIFCEGCSTLGNEASNLQSNFVGFKVGESRREAVYAKFGQPDDVLASDAKTRWLYITSKSSPNALTMVLGVLIWPLAFLAQTDFDITQTEFAFDSDGLLQDADTRRGERTKGVSSVVDAFSEEKSAVFSRIRAEMEKHGLKFDQAAAERSLWNLAL